jgi:hypothetical protein
MMACAKCQTGGCGSHPPTHGLFIRRTAPRPGDAPHGITFGALHGTPLPKGYAKLDAKGHADMFFRLTKVKGLDPKAMCVLSHWAGGVPEKAVGGSAGAQLAKVWQDIKWHDAIWLAPIYAKVAGGAYEYAATGGPKTIEHYCPGGPSVTYALAQLETLESAFANEVKVRGADHRRKLILNIEENVAQEQRRMVRKAANVVMDGASGLVRTVTGLDTSTSQIALGVGAGVVVLGLGLFIYMKVRS